MPDILGAPALNARLAAIVECSDDAIVSKTLDGVIASWNHGAERIFGYTVAEAIGRPMTLIIPPERHDEEVHILERLRNGERVDHFETVRVTKNGVQIDVSVTVSPIRNEAGVVIGASKIARDITAQKRIERELSEARESAERAQAVAEKASRAKDHFLSVLSHELRTPLTPALISLGLLEDLRELSADVREQIAMIRRNVETEASLVDDLLDVTRITRGKVRLQPEVIDAHSVLRTAIGMCQSDIDSKGLAVTLATRAKQNYIWADPRRFQQMLLNLLGNAIKFTPAGGDIIIRTTNPPEPAHIVPPTDFTQQGREPSSISIEFSDSGIGIEPELLSRLFRPFEQGEQTVTRRFGGLGLGLSIVKALADLQNATVSASSPGTDKGSTFVLQFPTFAGSLASTPAPDPSQADTMDCRILLVEDHVDTRSILMRLLRSLGCTVSAGASVREAMSLVHTTEFDLLLADIGLPDGSGHDVMRYVHSNLKIPGIAISGFGQDEDLVRSRDAGFSAHLTKPITLHNLRATIRQVAPCGGGMA